MNVSAFLLPVSTFTVFAALLLMIGAVTMRFLVLGIDDDSTARRSVARLGSGAGFVLILGLVGMYLAQLLAYNMPGDPLVPDARALVGTSWGRAWAAHAVLGLLAMRAYMTRPSRDLPVRDAIAGLFVVGMAFAPAFTGHAASYEPRWLSVGADGVHVLAAGAWLGTLAALAFTTPWSREHAPLLLLRIRRLSPIALTAAPVVAITGLVSSWLRLSHISDLWLSSYGRVLVLKVLIFGAVLFLGYTNWKKETGRLETSGDPALIRRSIRSELLATVAVLVATAMLLSTPTPVEG